MESCCVCYEQYDDIVRCPKVLDCDHIVCLKCVNAIVASNKTKCPMCRHTTCGELRTAIIPSAHKYACKSMGPIPDNMILICDEDEKIVDDFWWLNEPVKPVRKRKKPACKKQKSRRRLK